MNPRLEYSVLTYSRRSLIPTFENRLNAHLGWDWAVNRNRECSVAEVDTSLTGARVVSVS
ncbi:MAG: hypothetical protein DMG21_15555 [Acidobacteria bacterium]|nr:MAG: hypothetical protein DMG21_15555 [Acidobacteriota bacterium]